MKSSFKQFYLVFSISFFISFLIEGVNDPNLFNFKLWRLNNFVNVLHVWITFVSTYYLFAFILSKSVLKYSIQTPKKLKLILISAFLISLTYVILSDILFYIFYYQIDSLSETTFYEFDLPITLVILSIGSFYFYQKNIYEMIVNTNQTLKKEAYMIENQLKVYLGEKEVFLSNSNIIALFLYQKLVWVQTQDNDTYLSNKSITDLTKKLDVNYFFRINRQVILSKAAIKGYRKLDYQKIEVIPKVELKKEVNLIISKYNAPQFKKWLTNSL